MSPATRLSKIKFYAFLQTFVLRSIELNAATIVTCCAVMTQITLILPTQAAPLAKPPLAAASSAPTATAPSVNLGSVTKTISIPNTLKQMQVIDNAATPNKPLEVSLGQGSLFVVHERPIIVHTACCDISLTPSTAVFIAQMGDQVSIFNMDEDKKREVMIVFPSKSLRIASLNQYLLLRTAGSTMTSPSSSSSISPPQAAEDLGTVSDIKVIRGKFDLPALLGEIPQFNDLLRSPRPQDKRIAERLLKTSAALSN